MQQFVLQQGQAPELRLFPHILELGIRKNASIQLNAFRISATKGIRVFFVLEGKFSWRIHQSVYTFFPGDAALILPAQEFGNEDGALEIGTITWIHIEMEKGENGTIVPGDWSNLSEAESTAICKILFLNNSPALFKFNDAGKILKNIQAEVFAQEIGFQARVNHQVDELLIQATRQLTKQSNTGRDFPKTFMHLEQVLRQNLAHQWTVEEMAALVGLGTTLFTEKVKSYSGFSPINYLINIRISEAIKMLKRPEISVTDIALDTGFYSSQHFSTTFKKLTGYRPSEFRKNHLQGK